MKRARFSALEMGQQGTSRPQQSTGAIPKTLIILALHPESCKEQPSDIETMKKHLELDPVALDRMQIPKPASEGDPKLSPLHHACKCLHIDCVRFLLDRGAAIDLDCSDGNNAIYYTIFGRGSDCINDPRCVKIVELILKSKQFNKKLYKYEEKFISDFKNLINNKLYNIIKLLLEYNELPENMLSENDFPKIYCTSFSPFTTALLKKDIELVKLFLLHGDEVLNYTRLENKFVAVPTALLKVYKKPEEFFRAARIFQLFGGNLWTRHVHILGDDRINKTAIEHLRDTPKLVKRFGSIADDYEDLMCNPLSLKDQCRLALWKSKGRNYWKEINEIQEVPREIKDFLQLRDL